MDITNEKPSERFNDCVVVSVAIKSPAKQLYKFLTDIENLSEFFPQFEFKRDTKGALKAGSIYYARRKGTKNWATYRVLILEANARMSAELTGKDRLFEALRYDHRLRQDGSKTISYEKVEYKFRYGILGQILNLLIGKRLLRKQVWDAHLRLKEKAEKRQILP